MTNINQKPSQFCTALVSSCRSENGAEIMIPKNYKHNKYKINCRAYQKYIKPVWEKNTVGLFMLYVW